ncbi:hypothetical protein NL476_28345, partial [Klebsiella pneumoniae]|nr:hypothetical protein [Klebsiella pneumoniae]
MSRAITALHSVQIRPQEIQVNSVVIYFTTREEQDADVVATALSIKVVPRSPLKEIRNVSFIC